MEFAIQHTWDSNPVGHEPIKVVFSPGQGGMKIEVFGPFFNDPAAPAGPPSQAFPGLWDYEGGCDGWGEDLETLDVQDASALSSSLVNYVLYNNHFNALLNNQLVWQ